MLYWYGLWQCYWGWGVTGSFPELQFKMLLQLDCKVSASPNISLTFQEQHSCITIQLSEMYKQSCIQLVTVKPIHICTGDDIHA